MREDEKYSSKNSRSRRADVRQGEPDSPHFLHPLRSIIVIDQDGPFELSVDEISFERVGYKAYGLSSLPSEWVPPFFVITPSCLENLLDEKKIRAWVAESLDQVGIRLGRQVIVRSSGASETMQNRGRFESKRASTNEIVDTINDLRSELSALSSGTVHWIVQEFVEPREKGHLSNERRLRYEKRDWVEEFEPNGNRPGYAVRIGVRRWRDGIDLANLDLSCTSEPEVSLRLRLVAMWGTQLHSRTHFEWVWDGQAIRIVQADIAEPPAGVDPRSLLPSTIPSIEVRALKVLRSANKEDYERYGKLRNAKLYRELGYNMPVFYVVDKPEVLERVLSGQIPPDLESDLAELTRRPLIIRTDGASIPSDKREMLPRSDELRSYSQARDWLLLHFRPRVEENGLVNSDLCLIAHHFIPSVSSAWAWAAPKNRIVRIESLWGIPEGLYWYSHDTFEVDTQDVVEFIQSGTRLRYKSWNHLRYKGSFIAPDETGKWIPYQPEPPYDWKKSISRQTWVFEIAQTTRLIAEQEKHPVSVMWFIENHPQATSHKVLPWFHSKSALAGTPKAAPRRKRTNAGDFILRTSDDWHKLQAVLKSGTRTERVVVEPIDLELIRNLKFAEDLADLAVLNGFVIELSGGILSHAYYTLQRRGAQVECVDLVGTDEDVVEYNKVVRDKIPDLIEARGERVETVRLAGDALVAALRQKLVEEAFEALDAKSGSELISELADVAEVVKALTRSLKVTTTQLETERKDKQRRRGAFNKGLMLTKTGTPHSIQKQPITPEAPALDLRAEEFFENVISQVADIPAKSVYRRPDLRQVDYQIEKLFTFATETNRIGEVKESLNFSLPIENQAPQNFTLTVELRRVGSSVRGVVRLRRNPSQLKMEFQVPESQLEIEFPE